jgi:uncharacterized protein YjbI with pentapeptide repeats
LTILKSPAEAAEGKSAATEALLRFADPQHQPRDQPSMAFDGADLSAAGLGSRVQGAAWWDTKRGGVRLKACRLAGASLRGANLSGADLAGADLGKASCNGIMMHGAQLEEATLRGADLIGGVLTEVDAGEADFSETLLEDVNLKFARLRFADFTSAIMDGADVSGADLWGARLLKVEAQRTNFRGAHLDEAQLNDADLASADLTGASLRRANLSGARLRGAILRDAALDGANLDGADLSGAVLPHVALTSCTLRQVRFAGAWLERTRMHAHQLGGATGEETAGDFEAAREGYIVLEQNFRTLGSADDASWAFRRRRRMGKRLHAQHARTAFGKRDVGAALRPSLQWLGDVASEWVCDYGESVTRVLRAFLVVLVGFAAVYWLSGCLEPREAAQAGAVPATRFPMIDYLLFSLDSMTTVGTSEVGLKPGGQLGVLLSSVQTVVGTVLLGLFGFVLGVKMRN